MNIEKLKINPNNPQKFDDLSKLENSIKEFPKMMELRPIIYDPSNMQVLGGNKRLICLQNLGYKEIPDTWIKSGDELTEDEKKRFIIADNVGFGEWDWNILETEFDDCNLKDWNLSIDSIDNLDYSDKNQEIDTDSFDDEMIIKLKYTEYEYLKVKEQLLQIAETPEQAVWKLLKNE